MKKLLSVVVLLVAAFILVGCNTVSDEILVDAAHDYYAAGAVTGWGDAVGNDEFKMEAIARSDERVASIVDELEGAVYLYLVEVTILSSGAGWTFTYTIDGVATVFDGNQAIKMIRTDADGEIPNWWGPSPESGEFFSLTPETYYIPPYVETPSPQGDWNSNPGAFAAATYYMIFADFGTGEPRGLGLIAK